MQRSSEGILNFVLEFWRSNAWQFSLSIFFISLNIPVQLRLKVATQIEFDISKENLRLGRRTRKSLLVISQYS